jgi:hypothetical protein
MDHTENTPVSIVVVKLLQLPSKGLHDTVSNSNAIVSELCLLRCCIVVAVVSLFVWGLCLAVGLYAYFYIEIS